METLSYSARGNVEKIIFRAFSIAVLLTGLEVIGNAIFQSSVLNPTHWLLVALVFTSQIGLVYGAWLSNKPKGWMIFHGLSPIVVILLWPLLATNGAELPADFRPWVWWAMGMSAISLSIAFKPPVSLLGAVGVTLSWFLFSASPIGGEMDLERRIQDSVLVLMLGGVFGSLAGLIIAQFEKVDQANSDSLRESVSRAQQETRERERGLVYALVHDRVLNTLLVASKAKSAGEFSSAAESAEQALQELAKMREPANPDQPISSLALFKGLQLASEEYENVVVTSAGGAATNIPADVGGALTQAALQAIENSRKHSGASKTFLDMQASNRDVKIVVKDRGKGFRISRVGKNRLGVKLSIIGRVRAVGGEAEVRSNPGEGTEVVLKWTR